jgi:hypothetical protein
MTAYLTVQGHYNVYSGLKMASRPGGRRVLSQNMVGKALKARALLNIVLVAFHDRWNDLCCEGREKTLGALGSFDTASSAFPWLW